MWVTIGVIPQLIPKMQKCSLKKFSHREKKAFCNQRTPSIVSGTFLRHLFVKRVWKQHPDGGDKGEGISPWSNSLSLRLSGVISGMTEND